MLNISNVEIIKTFLIVFLSWRCRARVYTNQDRPVGASGLDKNYFYEQSTFLAFTFKKESFPSFNTIYQNIFHEYSLCSFSSFKLFTLTKFASQSETKLLSLNLDFRERQEAKRGECGGDLSFF